ncbi:transposase [Streptomyces sp. NPDC101150]|uniref:transposase n=1 Tax=Streptomyces sp. NPDC101150 TaxID=3366114 RepID=UPI00382263CA
MTGSASTTSAGRSERSARRRTEQPAAGRILIDRELYLGRTWVGTTADHERRCAEQGIPSEHAGHVASRPELARRMRERALAAKVPFSYFLADEAYGQGRTRRARLEERQARYVLAVPTREVVVLPDGRTRHYRTRAARTTHREITGL